MTFGEKIKHLRIAKDMTQDGVAEKLSVTRQTIHKYETGIVTNIPLDKVEILANMFDVSPSYLMGWIDTEKLAAPVWSDEQARKNIDKFSAMSADQQAEALRYMEFRLRSGEYDA